MAGRSNDKSTWESIGIILSLVAVVFGAGMAYSNLNSGIKTLDTAVKEISAKLDGVDDRLKNARYALSLTEENVPQKFEGKFKEALNNINARENDLAMHGDDQMILGGEQLPGNAVSNFLMEGAQNVPCDYGAISRGVGKLVELKKSSGDEENFETQQSLIVSEIQAALAQCEGQTHR